MALIEEHNQNNHNFADLSPLISRLIDFPPQKQHEAAEFDQFPPPATDGTLDTTMVKKLSHNASERDRRKKINYLYSSLRSLLPATDQMKKLTNPATVSRALKYIPELENQVKALIQKKEELMTSFSRRLDSICQERQMKSSAYWRSTSTVSASRLSDGESVLQISTFKVLETPLSHILLDLEEEGFSLLNATSHESFDGRVFYCLHLRV